MTIKIWQAKLQSVNSTRSNENIDVINFSEDIALYIARALAPAKLKDIYLDKAAKVAKIVADEDQISLIIGKNGQNIKLASRLTGYEIDVERKGGKKAAAEVEDADDEDEEEETEENETQDTAAEPVKAVKEKVKKAKKTKAKTETKVETAEAEETEEEESPGNKK